MQKVEAVEAEGWGLRLTLLGIGGAFDADLGIAKMIAEGDVENLTQLLDFSGRYLAVEAGVAAGKGVSRRVLRNQHGVVIRLASQLTGVALTLGAEGFEISLR